MQYHSVEHDDGILEYISGIFLGLLVGGIVGLLFAPRPGAETRAKIAEYLEEIPEKLKDDFQDPQGNTRSFFGKTFYKLEGQVGRLEKAFKANQHAKAKAREELATSGGYSDN